MSVLRVRAGEGPLRAEHERLLRTALRRGANEPERREGETIDVAQYEASTLAAAKRVWLERMVNEHLLNENEFWTAHPVTSVAKCEEGYRDRQYFTDLGCNWRATTWIPLNYMIYHGLRRYGFRDAATALAGKTAQLVRTAGNREWYDTATGEGRGLDPFWGWSLLGHFIEWEDSLAAL